MKHVFIWRMIFLIFLGNEKKQQDKKTWKQKLEKENANVMHTFINILQCL